MRKLICYFMACFLVLPLIGCAIEADSGIANDTSDTTNTDETANSYPAAAVWPVDAWSIATPEQQGLNSEMLGRADKEIHDNYPNVYSLLVVRHGYLVYEKYYQGMDKNDANPVFSVTKSVMSALTGIALRDGLISSTDQKLSKFFPEYFTQIDDTQKNDITIKNVLTMTGGLESIDSDYYSYFTSPDLLKYVLQKPLSDRPGDTFAYNTGLTHFLSAVITDTSGKSTKDFADENLFSKIGISVENWESDSNGYNYGGTGLYLKPLDMAKFGFLYLHNGLWNGNQIIPEEWIKESTQKQITANSTADYGYLFWLQTIEDTVNGKEYAAYRASGMGGQYIMVIPDLDMIVVVTANSDMTSKDGADTLKIITDYCVPAAE